VFDPATISTILDSRERHVSHAALMDKIYRHQRHVYDLTRRFFLPGRDRLIGHMDIRPGDRVLEVGCGTARNLIRIARSHPQARLYGLDASAHMLATAERSLKKNGLSDRIQLRRCMAEDLACRDTFGLDDAFDAVLFSYSLTMIPDGIRALDAALASLRAGRSLYIVDFWDLGEFPRWFREVFARWLGLFHVVHRPEILEHLCELHRAGDGVLGIMPLARRYAFAARFTRCVRPRRTAFIAENVTDRNRSWCRSLRSLRALR
jgi:S-adenosylmethionine-diacylgycerolhomoserine-N-methlytransferase